MLTDLNDPDGEDDDLGPRGAGALSAPQDDGDAGGATLAEDPQPEPVGHDSSAGEDQGGEPATGDGDAPPSVEPVDDPVVEPPHAAAPAPVALEDIDTAQLFLDRPDVFQGFFTAYYGPGNDHHSHAWADRVGEATPEAYALYWYKTYGADEGYVPTAIVRPAAAPVEPVVRTTGDGIPLDQILHDRPDVFQGFFTAFYGPNNDHHSSAWNDRVGGETPQDYANYWYETYGKAEGYGAAPSPVFAPVDGEGEGEPQRATLQDSGEFLLT